jgi:uncharacterized coiled-coil DUF342 family protein
MARSRLVWAATVSTVAVFCLAKTGVHAADGPASDTLKKNGLHIAGTLALADEEPQIKTSLAEARRLSKQLNYSLMQQKGTLSPGEMQQTVKNINNEISQLRSELSAAGQQMNAIPKWRGRFVSNDAAMIHAQLNAYRTQLQMEITQDSTFLNQLKSQTADPRAREKIDSEVRDRRDAYHQALVDLRKLVDSATEKYAEIANNDEVKKALTTLGKGLRVKPKLGPSHDFHNNVKLLERLEKAESGGETEAGEAKPARRSRGGTRTKNSSKGSDGQNAKEGSSRSM